MTNYDVYVGFALMFISGLMLLIGLFIAVMEENEDSL